MIQDGNQRRKKKMSNAIKCDLCEKIFFSDQIKIEKENVTCLPEEIKEPIATYYKCPHCKAKYLIGVKSKDIKELLLEFEVLKVRHANQLRTGAPQSQLERNIEVLQEMYKKIVCAGHALKEAVLDATDEYANKRVCPDVDQAMPEEAPKNDKGTGARNS